MTEQPKSTEIVLKNDLQPTEVAPVAEVRPSENAQVIEGQVQPPPIISIDSVSKMLAVILVFVYVSGFLITSLHNFQYGFSEMNPLRPRILSAGGWFGIFLGVPFALVWELRKHSASTDKKIDISNLSGLVVAYASSALILSNFSNNLFSFDTTPSVTTSSSLPWWKIVLFVLGGLAALVAIVVLAVYVISKVKSHAPKWLGPALILVFYGYMVFSAYSTIFIKHSFESNAMWLWLFGAGGCIYYELKRRQWTLQAGEWQRTLIGFFVTITIFATIYYPHIKAKWGGGTPIPIELTFSKDALVNAGKQVDCSLIDETDSGFYVIGKGDAFATFIPRTEVFSIYYGQGNGNSVLHAKQ